MRMQSPCISLCRIDSHTCVCEGCYRTLEEIAKWRSMTDDRKREVAEAAFQRSKKLLTSGSIA
jgi:predicted Fe-S protein YdhL (DUF1289 family)